MSDIKKFFEFLGSKHQDQESEPIEAVKIKALTAEQTKELEQQMGNLPILEHAAEIKELIKNNITSIVIGETGSGKTTQIPLMLSEILPEKSKVAITQPRKVAARSVCRYVAEKSGCNVGEEVGYQVRFDDHTSEGTRINFMTDGILLRKMQQDPLLKEYSAVMVDEAHERSLNIDFILGLLKRTQRLREQNKLEPLKIIVTSATLEKEKFLEFFDQPPAVEVPGRLFPVDIHYESRMPEDYTKVAAEKVQSIINQGKEGDILIFMPGQEEIFKTISEIEELKLSGFMLLPLYGQMSPEDQDRIFSPSKVRKVIVATNIAETSVTIPGVRHVIDSGLIKQTEFEPYSGVESLKTVFHAQSGLIQRAGRAGRTASGECYRLYPENDFNDRPQFQKPEMLRSNLANVVLMMKSIGIEKMKNFEFIDKPNPLQLEQALENLKSLGALDEDEKITSVGELMAELPLEPHMSRMVIEAQKYNCTENVCTIAAFLGGRNVFVRPKEKEDEADEAHAIYKNKQSDFLTLLNVWQSYERNNGDPQRSYEWARKNFLNYKVLQEVKDIRYQLFRVLGRNGIRAAENQDPVAIAKSVSAGLIDNLLAYDFKYKYKRIKDGMEGIYIHPSSATSFGDSHQLIIPAEVVKTESTDKRTGEKRLVMRARTVQVVKPEWIEEIAPQLVRKEQEEAYFNEEKGSFGSHVNYYIRGIYQPYLVEFKEIKGEEATKMLVSYLMRGKIDLPLLAKNKKTLNMINTLYVLSGGKIEKLTPDDLFNFYFKRLGAISSSKELLEALEEKSIDLELNMDDYVDAKLAEKTMRENPAAVRLNGREYRIDYEITGLGNNQIVTSTVKIPAKELLEIKNIPELPGGRNLVVAAVDESGYVLGTMSSSYLDDLKKGVSRKLNQALWDLKRPEKKYIGERSDFTSSYLPALPGPESIGVDPLTSEAVIAYPAYVDSHGSINLEYFMDEDEAKTAQAKTEQSIIGMRDILGLTKKKKELKFHDNPSNRQTSTQTKAAIDEVLKKKFKK